MKDIVTIGSLNLKTLVAVTEMEQQQGLMHKESPTVMCFPFKMADVHKFWMHNTKIPLDIIFCKSGKIVDVCNGIPYSLKFVGPNSLTDMVIEVPAGTVAKNNIKIGDDIKIKYSIKTLAKMFADKISFVSVS